MNAFIYCFKERLSSLGNYGYPMANTMSGGEELIFQMWELNHTPVGTCEYVYTNNRCGMYVFSNKEDHDSFYDWISLTYDRFGEEESLPTCPPDGSYPGGMAVFSINNKNVTDKTNIHKSGLEKPLVAALTQCIRSGSGKIFYFNNQNGGMKLIFTDEATAMIFRLHYL